MIVKDRTSIFSAFQLSLILILLTLPARVSAHELQATDLAGAFQASRRLTGDQKTIQMVYFEFDLPF
ncbi:MAG: hypothetical protein EBR09_02100 [Proteobacteria bacterium]|nr:hypothetical protein [Pseudomonadota bacterium]